MDVPHEGRVGVEARNVLRGEGGEERALDVVQRRVHHLVVVWMGRGLCVSFT